ncbi:MAG: ABC transporter permease, partial [Pseudomonadota bacterium]
MTFGERFRVWRSGDEAMGLVLIGPALLYAILLLAVPLGAILLISFYSQNGLDLDMTPTLKNYREAFSDPIYRTLLFRSIVIAAVVAAVTGSMAGPH